MRAFFANAWPWLMPRLGVARGAVMVRGAEVLRCRTGVAACMEARAPGGRAGGGGRDFHSRRSQAESELTRRKSARAAERRQGRVKAMTTGAQIRAARELLGWRQAELAKRSRIQAHSVESAESSLGQSFVPCQDMQAMRAVLEAAGVDFTNGVKLRRPGPQGGLGP